MPYKDSEAAKAYQREYQREYARRLRATPEGRETLLARKRTPQQRDNENARRKERYAEDEEYRKKAKFAVKNRKRAFSEGAEDYYWILRNDPCSYCGAPAESVDHIDAWVESADGQWENLTAACTSCNSSKGSRSLLQYLEAR